MDQKNDVKTIFFICCKSPFPVSLPAKVRVACPKAPKTQTGITSIPKTIV